MMGAPEALEAVERLPQLAPLHPEPLSVHATFGFCWLETIVAVNCCVPPGTCTLAVLGETLIVMLGVGDLDVIEELAQPQQSRTTSTHAIILTSQCLTAFEDKRARPPTKVCTAQSPSWRDGRLWRAAREVYRAHEARVIRRTTTSLEGKP